MSLMVEGVVDGGMDVEKTLRGSRRLESLHLALSSPHDLMGVFSAIVLSEAPIMRAGEAPESMRFPVNSLLTGNFGASETGSLRDSLLQRRVRCEPDFRGYPIELRRSGVHRAPPPRRKRRFGAVSVALPTPKVAIILQRQGIRARQSLCRRHAAARDGGHRQLGSHAATPACVEAWR
jgi:hypothetical protein